MKQELQNKLVEKYPEIFKEIGSDPQYSCMAFGIECGDGWYELIDTLCAVIHNVVDNNVNYRWEDTPYRLSVRAAQVKQKFGTLRFYVSIGWTGGELDDDKRKTFDRSCDTIYGAIAMAERMSAKICESCGQPGSVDPGFCWLRCECDACRSKQL